MKRVPPSIRLKEEIEGLLGTSETAVATEEAPMVGFVSRLARYMLQVAIEAEATAFLGRGHYRRGDRERVGWRNGYEPKHLQTEAGALELAVPQLRGTAEAFRPCVVDLLAHDPDLLSVEIFRRTKLAGYPGGKSALYDLIRAIEQEHGQPRHATAESGLRGVASARSE